MKAKRNGRALRPNQQERAQRRAAIDVLLHRAIRGVLSTTEAALLAEYVRAEQRLADTTRRSLADTTRALQKHRAAVEQLAEAVCTVLDPSRPLNTAAIQALADALPERG